MNARPHNRLLGKFDDYDDVERVLTNVTAVIEALDHIDFEQVASEGGVYGAHLMREMCIDALEYVAALPQVRGLSSRQETLHAVSQHPN